MDDLPRAFAVQPVELESEVPITREPGSDAATVALEQTEQAEVQPVEPSVRTLTGLDWVPVA